MFWQMTSNSKIVLSVWLIGRKRSNWYSTYAVSWQVYIVFKHWCGRLSLDIPYRLRKWDNSVIKYFFLRAPESYCAYWHLCSSWHDGNLKGELPNRLWSLQHLDEHCVHVLQLTLRSYTQCLLRDLIAAHVLPPSRKDSKKEVSLLHCSVVSGVHIQKQSKPTDKGALMSPETSAVINDFSLSATSSIRKVSLLWL